MQWYNSGFESFLSFFFNTDFFNTDFVTWIVTFYQLMLVAMDVMHEADNTYSVQSTWLCYWLVQFLI